MYRYLHLIIACSVLPLIFSCTGSSGNLKKTASDQPEWFKSTSTGWDSAYVYASISAKDADSALSVERALFSAESFLVKAVDEYKQNISRELKEESGDQKLDDQAFLVWWQKVVPVMSDTDFSVTTRREGNLYKTYYLLRLSKANLDAQIHQAFQESPFKNIYNKTSMAKGSES